MIFSEPPRYTMIPCAQDMVIEDGRIIAWTLRIIMTNGLMMNQAEEYYECQVGEVREVSGEIGGFLEQLLKKVDDERGFLKRCADELDQKIRMASIANEPLETPAV